MNKTYPKVVIEVILNLNSSVRGVRMRCSFLMVSTVILALLLPGCGASGDNDVANDPANEAAPDPVQPSPGAPTPKPEPLLQAAASPTPAPILTNTVLIRPTDPEARLRVIKSGRNDPFAAVVSPIEKPPAGGPPATPPQPAPLPARPINLPTQPTVTLPPLPQPDLARQVEVKGIALFRGVPQAIVKAPEEPVARTVVAGDRLAQGQVLVKHIDVNRVNPVVILEEVGIDVVVGVGRPAVEVAAGPRTSLPPLPNN